MKNYTIRITRTDEWSINIKAKDDEEVEERIAEMESIVEDLDTTHFPEVEWNGGDWDLDYELQ